MMKQKSKINLIGPTGIVIALFAITLFSVGTFAWLRYVKQTQTQGLQYLLEDSHGVDIKSYHIYKRDGIVGARRMGDEERIYMTEYDQVITEKNVDTPIIMRIELENVPDNCDIMWTVTCPPKEDSWLDAEGKMLNNFSNIVGVRFRIDDSNYVDQYYNENPEEEKKTVSMLYSKAVEFLGGADSYSFAEEIVKTGTGDKYDHKDKVSELSSVIKKEDFTLKDHKLIIYVEIEYNPINVASFIEDYQTSTEYDDNIAFPDDLGRIRFDYIEP